MCQRGLISGVVREAVEGVADVDANEILYRLVHDRARDGLVDKVLVNVPQIEIAGHIWPPRRRKLQYAMMGWRV